MRIASACDLAPHLRRLLPRPETPILIPTPPPSHPTASPSPGASQRMKSSAFLLALALVACALCLPPDHGVPAAAPPATSADPAAEFAAIRPLLKTYCAKCHNPSDQDGGVDFASITESSVTRHRALWKRGARR